MATRISILIFSFLFTIYSSGQESHQNLISQARQMANYFKSENYESYVDYVYPGVIEMAGGAENMINLIEQQMSTVKNNQMQIVDVIMGKPTSIFNYNGNLQSSIPQSIVIKTAEGRITSKYNLIAISSDEGENWTFIDTSGKDIETMKKTFPNLSSKIVLPTKEVIQE